MSDSADRISATLGGYAAETLRTIDSFLVDVEPSSELYDLVRDYPHRPGKGMRPGLLLATCQAFGGSMRDGLATAAALEMLHNAFLIHDDIEDDSCRRRKGETLHKRHGLGLALNAGDALASLAMQPVRADAALGGRLSKMLMAEFSTVVKQTTEGQAIELGWRWNSQLVVRPDQYLVLAGKKTSWYTTVAPLRMGAIIGSRGTASLRALSRFGYYLGLVFQIADDLLDIEEHAEYEKDALGDIREGKHTLLLIHLLDHAMAEDRARVVEFLTRSPDERVDPDELMQRAREVRDLMKAYGSIKYAEQCAADIAAAAEESFDQAFHEAPASEHLDFIRGVIDFVRIRRT